MLTYAVLYNVSLVNPINKYMNRTYHINVFGHERCQASVDILRVS